MSKNKSLQHKSSQQRTSSQKHGTQQQKPASQPVPAPRQKSMVIIAVAVVAVVALLALVAVVATSSTEESTSGDNGSAAGVNIRETAPVVVSGAALLPMPDNGTDLSIGAVAPRVEGLSFTGGGVSILPGSVPMVVLFVAHWCPHCQKEVPLVGAWAKGGTRNGVAVRAVSTSTSKDNPNFPPSAWLALENFTIPTLLDDEAGTVANAYGLTNFPFFVALDGSGKVVARTSGEITEVEFDQLVEKAKSGSPA